MPGWAAFRSQQEVVGLPIGVAGKSLVGNPISICEAGCGLCCGCTISLLSASMRRRLISVELRKGPLLLDVLGSGQRYFGAFGVIKGVVGLDE